MYNGSFTWPLNVYMVASAVTSQQEEVWSQLLLCGVGSYVSSHSPKTCRGNCRLPRCACSAMDWRPVQMVWGWMNDHLEDRKVCSDSLYLLFIWKAFMLPYDTTLLLAHQRRHIQSFVSGNRDNGSKLSTSSEPALETRHLETAKWWSWWFRENTVLPQDGVSEENWTTENEAQL